MLISILWYSATSDKYRYAIVEKWKYCDGLPIRRLSLLSNSRIYRLCCRCNRFPGILCRCHSTAKRYIHGNGYRQLRRYQQRLARGCGALWIHNRRYLSNQLVHCIDERWDMVSPLPSASVYFKESRAWQLELECAGGSIWREKRQREPRVDSE
jgi:hypothetical protein